MSYLIRRVLAKLRLILDEMCRLHGKFGSYLRRVLFFLVLEIGMNCLHVSYSIACSLGMILYETWVVFMV